MIFAHGPWFMEWHHLLPYLPIIGPGIVAWLAIRKGKKVKRGDDDE